MKADYRDMALDHLAADEAQLQVQLVEALRESEGYRLLAQEALHALHDHARQHDRLRDQHQRLVDEYRALRVQLLHDGRRAA